jgi:phage-related protein
MGFLDGLKSFASNVLGTAGKVANTVSTVSGKVADIAKGATSIGEKILNFTSKPMSELAAPIKEKVGGFLSKLPFGLGDKLKPVAEKVIDSAASWLSGPANVATSFLTKALPTVKKIAEFAEMLKSVSDKVGALANPVAQSNFQNQMAYAQGQLVH